MTKSDERARYTFRMPQDLMEKLKNESKQQGVSLNALILQILWEWIERREVPTDPFADDKDTA